MILDTVFKNILNHQGLHYENNFQPSSSIFFNHAISKKQIADIKLIKMTYYSVFRKAIESNIAAEDKETIIINAKKEGKGCGKNYAGSIINYHTNFLIGDTATRNSLDRYLTYAYQQGYLPAQKVFRR